MRYGLPYQGSKNKLAERIVALLPAASHLYDVFAGGCAISHAALLSGKWGTVHFSDINDSVVLFRDCLEGNVPDGSEWISREEFYRRRDTDPYVRLIWSFGNNQRCYLYSRKIEPYKRAVHEMIYAPTPTVRRLKFREVCALMPLIIERGQNRGCTSNGVLPEVAHRVQSAEFTPPSTSPTSSRWSEADGCSRLQLQERGGLPGPFAVGSIRCRWKAISMSKYSPMQ